MTVTVHCGVDRAVAVRPKIRLETTDLVSLKRLHTI